MSAVSPGLPSRRELTAPFLNAAKTPLEVRVDLGGCVIAVRTGDDALAKELTHYFQEFLSPGGESEIVITALESAPVTLDLPYAAKAPDPGKTKIKEEFCELADGRVVRKRLTGMVFIFGGGDNLVLGPCRENANQVVNFVNNRFIERMLNQGCQLGHAAGVRLCGRGLALAGFSGMGKSTLAMRLMSLGADFVSNDRILASRGAGGVCMRGVPKQPRVNPGTLLNNEDLAWIIDPEKRRELLALPADSLWRLEQKYDALIVDSFGPGKFVLTARMNGLVILNWRRDGGPVLVRAVSLSERPELLAAFMKSTGLFYRAEGPGVGFDRSPAAYAALLSAADVIEIAGGVDFDRAAAVCRDYLETGRISAGG
ncbi:MAG: HprK-related kinase B [Desulfovibrionaceae bacterium]|nr:HprK-related kinase B [Desulfovibrionaceae bacterium]MBF0513754.1 HprK-related kinase B [Desulfovibrionaceae bacterium]